MTSAEEFYDLFKGYERAFGKFVITGRERLKYKGEAKTSHDAMKLKDVEEHLSGGEYGIGSIALREDNTLVFAAIDIDKYENFDIIELENIIRRKGLPLVVCRSKSGGAHLYLFTKRPVDARIVVAKMVQYSAILGVAGVEIFPKQTSRAQDETRKDIGNWINLPYFNHQKTERYAIYEGKQLSLKEFLQHAKQMQVTEEELEVPVIQIPVHVDEMFYEGPPCLKYLVSMGGFPEGTRNDGMYNVGVYLKNRYPEGNVWKDKLMEYNTKICDPSLPLDEINTLVKSLSNKEYNFTCKKTPICNHCDRRTCLKQRYGVNAKSDTDSPPVEITNLQKYLGDPVLWGVEIDGTRLLVETEVLYSQSKFNLVCMDKINRIPGTIGKAKWERYLDEHIKNADIIPVPEDASSEGQFFLLLEDYCYGSLKARQMDEVAAGKPYSNEGKTYFKSKALLEYLTNHRYKIKSEHHLWHMLRKKGAEEVVKKVRGKAERMWCITDFNPHPVEKKGLDFQDTTEVF